MHPRSELHTVEQQQNAFRVQLGLCFCITATAWQQRWPYVVIEYLNFCVEGMRCSAIQCQVTREVKLCLSMVSGASCWISWFSYCVLCLHVVLMALVCSGWTHEQLLFSFWLSDLLSLVPLLLSFFYCCLRCVSAALLSPRDLACTPQKFTVSHNTIIAT